jgi:hypothetical protein
MEKDIKFKEKAQNVHGNNYNYDKVKYEKAIVKVIIICPKHGDFEQTPNSHLNGRGCPNCGVLKTSKSRLLGYNGFIKKAQNVHGNNYNYTKVNYVNYKTKVIIICPEHGEFEQTPRCHLRGDKCKKCFYDSLKSDTLEFINRGNKIHNNKYDYSKVKYTGTYKRVIIICDEHGEFTQTPTNHINKKRGCLKCGKNSSKLESEFLDRYKIPEEFRNYSIKFNGKRYCVDGIDKKNKIIYEFYGDFFHGNPRIYDKYKVNPLIKKRYGELYNKTINREKEIIGSSEYKIISIWEDEFKLNKNGI